jgi:uncharacterized membrane protein
VDQLHLRIGAEEMLVLRGLVGLDADERDAEAIATVAMRQGLAAMLAKTGLDWPSPDALVDPGSTSTVPPEPDDAGPAGAPQPRSKLAQLWSRRGVRASVSAVAAAALLVLLAGGYGDGWSWTGFSGNDQLWDWLHLLLLPIAFGTFPLWLKYGGYMSRPRKLVLAALVLGFAGLVAAGYLAPLGWTGFPGNTLWDWLTLLVLPLVLMTVRMWPSTRREVHAPHIALAAVLGLAWLTTLIGGYAADWSWTGYPGNTLWDWLSLLLGPVVITSIVIPASVRWVSGDVARIAEQEEKSREQAGQRPSSHQGAQRSDPPATGTRSGPPRR